MASTRRRCGSPGRSTPRSHTAQKRLQSAVTGNGEDQAWDALRQDKWSVILESRRTELKLQNLFIRPVHFSKHGDNSYKPYFRKSAVQGACLWINTTECCSVPSWKMGERPTPNWRAR
ncbi:hypothetical protein EMIT0P176_20129 [Pseudomonas sp. IT-P176]